MPHGNAPLTPEGRRRLCERVAAGRPASHVAAEAGVSRQTLSKWYARWLEDGDAGLLDRSSRPVSSPNATPDELVAMVLAIRRDTKWGATRIAHSLARNGVDLAPATVHRILVRNGLSRRRDMDPPTGEQLRGAVKRYEHAAAGDMIHIDVKKLGRIPEGGGWRLHGRDSDAARASKRGKGRRVGFTYVHAAVDDYSRLAYAEALDDEKGITAAQFWHRAVEFFRLHGITPIRRALTDNGSCYRSRVFEAALKDTATTHKRTRPHTPKTNGKVERFNGILASEWAYAKPYYSEAERRAALSEFLNYYNHERPHSALKGGSPVDRTLGSDFRLTVEPIDVPIPLDDQPSLFDDPDGPV